MKLIAVEPGDGDSFENSQLLEAVNYFLKDIHPRRLTSNLKAPYVIICDKRVFFFLSQTRKGSLGYNY